MSKKLWFTISVIVTLALIILSGGVVLADDGANNSKVEQAKASNVDLNQLMKRIFEIKDEAKFDEALANFSASVKAEWKRQQQQREFEELLKRLLEIKDEARFTEALNKLISDNKITAEQAERIKMAWQKQRDAEKERQRIAEITKQLMAVKEEAKLDDAIAQLINDGILTQEQAARIKAEWKKQQERLQFNILMQRLLSIKEEAKLDEAITQLIGEGKLTQEQAAKIKEEWKKQQARLALEQMTKRLLSIQNEAEFKAALDKLVADGKLTAEQAEKIKAQWIRMHTLKPATTATKATD